MERRGGEEEKGKGGEGRETGEESAREQCDMLPVSVCRHSVCGGSTILVLRSCSYQCLIGASVLLVAIH